MCNFIIYKFIEYEALHVIARFQLFSFDDIKFFICYIMHTIL